MLSSVKYQSKTEVVLFSYLLSDWATTSKLFGSMMGNSIKCLPQGHSDALRQRESCKVLKPFDYYPGALPTKPCRQQKLNECVAYIVHTSMILYIHAFTPQSREGG